jgi:hypothetical protein
MTFNLLNNLQSFIFLKKVCLGVVVHICNPSTWEAEEERVQVLGQSARSCLKQQNPPQCLKQTKPHNGTTQTDD